MDQIIPGLWIGDLACALATDYLEIAGITHIVTAMKQSLPAPIQLPDGRTIAREHIYNVHVDDVESAPILVHLPGAVEFIDDVLQQTWLDDPQPHSTDDTQYLAEIEAHSRTQPPPGKQKGQWATMGQGSVLIHCQAGISRSVAVSGSVASGEGTYHGMQIATAYLMRTRQMTSTDALQLIQSRRPQADPNPGFMHQLELYESGGYEVDVRNQRTRRFLMSQFSILKGDPIEDVLLSYYPTPTHSPANSTGGGSPHGGMGSVLQFSPLDGDSDGASQRFRAGDSVSVESSSGRSSRVMSRQNSRVAASSAAAQGAVERQRRVSPTGRRSSPGGRASPEVRRRRPRSMEEEERRSCNTSVDLSKSPPIGANICQLFDEDDEPGLRDKVTHNLIRDTFTSVSEPHEVMITVSSGKLPGGVSRVRGVQSEKGTASPSRQRLPKPNFGASKLRCKKCRRELAARDHVVEHDPGKGKDAFDVRKRSKDAEQKSRDGRAAMQRPLSVEEQFGAHPRPLDTKPHEEDTGDAPSPTSGSTLQSAASLSSSLPPQLAALRLGRTQPESPTKIDTSALRRMLHSPQCSAYFVEPLAWMTNLQEGQVAGRLECPNVRCGAKLGSWDWAGMQCAW